MNYTKDEINENIILYLGNIKRGNKSIGKVLLTENYEKRYYIMKRIFIICFIFIMLMIGYIIFVIRNIRGGNINYIFDTFMISENLFIVIFSVISILIMLTMIVLFTITLKNKINLIVAEEYFKLNIHELSDFFQESKLLFVECMLELTGYDLDEMGLI